jgi:hypothetical protein
MFALAVGTSSCKDFLDKHPYSEVDSSGEISDAMAVALTNACYTILQGSDMYNMRIWTTDIIAGNCEVGAGGGTDGLETIQVANFVTTSDNDFARYIWRSPWPGIAQSNLVIKDVGRADITQSVKERCLGEAYFVRAHCYFLLVRLFGDIPLRLEPAIPGVNLALARRPQADIYTQIIDDLKQAALLLPAKSEYSSTDLGRASKDAALTQLAKVYLTLAPGNPAYYDEVIRLCDEVTALGYNLTGCRYEDNFGALANNGTESIFEIQFTGSTKYDFWGSNCQSSWLSTFMGPRNSNWVGGGWGWNQPTAEFVGQYEAGDKRKEVTVLYSGCPTFDGMTYDPDWSMTGYNCRKFLVSKSVSPDYNTNPANFVVYRYADILLMKAEALNEKGQTTLAGGQLNIVRTRAGLGDISGLSKEDMRDAIIRERRMEFAFEGHRWFDIIRIGTDGTYAVNFLRSIGKSNATRQKLLLPIPQTEMDANPAMTQNEGY